MTDPKPYESSAAESAAVPPKLPSGSSQSRAKIFLAEVAGIDRVIGEAAVIRPHVLRYLTSAVFTDLFEAAREEGDEQLGEEIDRVLAEVADIDRRILQDQASIDDLKEETRTMLAALRESLG